ncbi:hypothetical protein ACMFMG_002738 [Clarireedia jacksonii]
MATIKVAMMQLIARCALTVEEKFSTVHTPGPNARAVTGLDTYHDEDLLGDGPLQVSFSEEYTPATQGAWIESFNNLRWKMSADPRTGKAIGAFQNPASIDPKSGSRSFWATAYYGAEARARKNLVVVTEALVKKITTEKSGEEILATGVIIQTKEGEKTISARHEVILAAGALQSPQILELSGIGGKELLQRHGISVILDNLGVGENLQDHAFAAQSFEVADGVPSADVFRDPTIIQAVAKLYASNNGAGPLGMSPLVNAYLPLVDHSGPVSAEAKKILLDSYLEQSLETKCLREIIEASDEPTGQYLFLPFQLTITPNPKDLTELLVPVQPENYMTLVTVLNHPFSRGSVHIVSPDINVKPEWDPKYMSHPLDLEILARHVQYGEKFMRTPPFSDMLKPGGRRLPEIVGDDLENAKEIVRQHQLSIFHPTGSLRMLPREQGGVVNERLMVHGTKNLRVVDASIFPLQTLGTIQATVYAVAERAADFILEDFRK